MAKHHYLPAALIGGFSADSSRPLRERVVWVRRRGVSRAFHNSAENLGYVRDLYTLIEDHGQPPDMIDRAWRVYEPGLPDGIAALIDSHARPLRADVWTRVLVPFAVGLFVRGPEFNRRFETRLVPIIGTTSTFFTPTRITDNTNQARLFEMQRLMFPIVTAEWTVVHCTGSGIAITSDVGYCLMRHLQGGGVGYAIPLRPDAVLVLRTRSEITFTNRAASGRVEAWTRTAVWPPSWPPSCHT